jgi:Flp pilus assembly protein TadD
MTLEPQNFAAGQSIQEAVRHYEAGRFAEAEMICNRVLEIESDDANAVYLLGEISHLHGNLDRAVELMERAIILKPGNPFFLNNLGEILREQNRPADAELLYRRALALKPDFTKAHNNLGNALQSLRRYDEAEQCYSVAIKLDPALALPRLNLGLLKLLRGDYRAGFEHYEHRFDGADARQTVGIRDVLGRLKGRARWCGDPLQGKRILVWAEQGLGDCVMMMRYLPLLVDRGAGSVLVLCAMPLVRLMRTVDGVEDAVSLDDDWSEESFDVHCPIMSLPFLFGTTLETVPAVVPYVRITSDVLRKWEFRLEKIQRPRVGLVWAGGKRTAGEARRSMHLRDFAPLLDAGGASFVSLQKGADEEELRGVQWPIVDFMSECDDLLDTAGLIGQLDLVISVDTSVAHLAGALGKPVWVLTREVGAWQWMLESEDSPWYPTVRIFRLPHDEDRHESMAGIAALLKSTFGESIRGNSPEPGNVLPSARKSLWTQLISRRKE